MMRIPTINMLHLKQICIYTALEAALVDSNNWPLKFNGNSKQTENVVTFRLIILCIKSH